MSFYLRKAERSRGLYLTIYETYWDDARKSPRTRLHQTLGYVSDIEEKGIRDPVGFYTSHVQALNRKRRNEEAKKRERTIGASPQRNIGYFLLKAVWRRLRVDKDLELLQSTRGFEFSAAELLQALIYARVIRPGSKRHTLAETIPLLYEEYSFSYDQVLEGIEFIGSEYEKVIEIFTHQTAKFYGLDRDVCYFDGTNFYFEIDKEDLFRKKGPSKENRHDPIVGMGLLLDANMIPISMRMYPGNQSEIPVLRNIIRDMKRRFDITGRTIQVADKGLNCGENIAAAIAEGDGYIFSRSVKKLSSVEQTWVLLEQDWEDVYEKNGRLAYRLKECVDEFPYVIPGLLGKKRKVEFKEKRVATFNPSLRRKKLLELDRMIDKASHLIASQAKRKEFGDVSKYVTFEAVAKEGTAVEDAKVTAKLNENAICLEQRLAGYNLIVTSEVGMSKQDVYSTYHNLAEIERSFRTMKSYLDARPVYVQKRSSIQGHFTVCYLSLLLLRLLTVYSFSQQYTTEAIIDFIRKLTVVRGERNGWINITAASDMISKLTEQYDIPITSYHLKTRQINALFNIRL